MAKLEIRSARLAVTPEIEQEAKRLLLHSEGHIPRLEAATVTITGPVDHHARGPFEVHVTFTTPRTTVTTSRTRDDSLRTALQDAFGAAEHRLRSRLERRRTLARNAAIRARAKRRVMSQEWGLSK